MDLDIEDNEIRKPDIEDKKAKLVERRKEQILAAARQIFAQNGFRRTRIDQIAQNLNIGKGTIYRYFKDKKSLFLAVFEQGMAQLRQAFQTNVEPIIDPKNKLSAAVRTYFGFFENNRDLIEIMMQVRSEFKEDYRCIFLALYSDYIVKIQENLRNGVKMRVFREMDVERTAEAISATLQGVLQSFYVREFGPEAAVPNPEKGQFVSPDFIKTNKTDHSPGRRKKSLTDMTEAVTALLLEGLLKAEHGNTKTQENL